MFDAFRARVTRAYVLLAVVLIVAIVGASSVLAFLLFSRGMNDAISSAAQRVTEAASQAMASGATLQQAAPRIAASVGRGRLHLSVIDAQGHRLAENEGEGGPSAGRSAVIAVARIIGLPHARVPVPGGSISIGADVDRFGGLLLWYWSIMLPIGIVAVLLAWLVGRRITANAVGPLADVTRSLHRIASGDFTPHPLRDESTALHDLTNAYNEVAYSLSTATAERQRTETQMRQFIADAGHELRTPLTIIMGYLDALRQGIVRDSEGTLRTYETMLDESRKMRTLIEKLILLARLDRAPQAALTAVDLGALVRRVAAGMAPLAAGRLRVDADGETTVLADESELYEAVKNLVDNALKYAPDSDVRIAVTGSDGIGCVEVADSGPGMEPQDVRHAFDRFYRGGTRGEIEGSGLGLAIAKRAAERAGGTAELESAQGEGTRVRLCLPILRDLADSGRMLGA